MQKTVEEGIRVRFPRTAYRPLPTAYLKKSTRRELNPHLRRGIAVRCRYITGAHRRAELSKPACAQNSEHRARLELALPHYGCGVVAAGPPVRRAVAGSQLP